MMVDERAQRLVDAIRASALLLLDGDGGVLLWSTGAALGFGRAATPTGFSWAVLFETRDVQHDKPAAILRAAAETGTYEEECWLLDDGGRRHWAQLSVAPVGAGGFAVVITDRTKHRAAEDDLALAQRRLAALAARVNETAEREKSDLAREVHDVLGQDLTGLKMDAAWIARRLTGNGGGVQDGVLERVVAMQAHVDDCVVSVRRIARGLRPGVLDDLGLASAVEWQSRDFAERSGLDVHVDVSGAQAHVERGAATAVFRVLQELLTNVVRHAGARCVDVRLSVSDSLLLLVVSDDGKGIAREQASDPVALGILGMRQRLAPYGGTLDFPPALGGTLARARVPLEPDAARASKPAPLDG